MHRGVIINKKNVFVTKEYADLLVNAMKMAELKKDIKNLAYVVMPNYFLWMFRLNEKQDNPSEIYGQVKKEVSLEMLNYLKEEKANGSFELMDIFKDNKRVGRSSPDRILWTFEEQAKNYEDCKRYKIWTPKSGVWPINDDKALQDGLDSIKKAPVSERWQFVEKAEDYPYLYVCDELEEDEVLLKNIANFALTKQLAAA